MQQFTRGKMLDDRVKETTLELVNPSGLICSVQPRRISVPTFMGVAAATIAITRHALKIDGTGHLGYKTLTPPAEFAINMENGRKFDDFCLNFDEA